jgi:hypothetical protein
VHCCRCFVLLVEDVGGDGSIANKEGVKHWTPLAMGINCSWDEDDAFVVETSDDVFTSKGHLCVQISLPWTQKFTSLFLL